MKMHASQLMHAILAGFTIGASLYGGWLFATEPEIGVFAFLPGVAMIIVALAFYAADGGCDSANADKTEGGDG